MAKMIKFDLPIDGMKVSTLDELRDHFTAEIVGHFRSGLLAKWLRSRRMTDQLEAVEALTANEDLSVLRGLCNIFEIETDEDTISAALAEPTGVSVGDLAEAIQVPALVLLAYLNPTGPSRKSTDNIISNKDKIKLLRHLILPALRNLRTLALGKPSKGRIAIKGECEVWVFENPRHGTIVIQTLGELNTKGCLLDSSGRKLVEENDDNGDGRNIPTIFGLHSRLYEKKRR